MHEYEAQETDACQTTAERGSLARLFGLGAAACAACCIGPILAAVGAITAGGILSTRAIGLFGFAIAASGAIAFLAVRRRRASGCEPSRCSGAATHL
jgi:hypothetical protein